MTHEKRKTLWCRNCNEMTTHELIGTKGIPAECNPPVFYANPLKHFLCTPASFAGASGEMRTGRPSGGDLSKSADERTQYDH